GVVDQFQLFADTLGRDEEPLTHASLTLDGAETASQGDVLLFARTVAATEFNPCISGPVGVPAHQKVPFDFSGWIRIRFQPLRNHFAVEQEWKLQREYTRF